MIQHCKSLTKDNENLALRILRVLQRTLEFDTNFEEKVSHPMNEFSLKLHHHTERANTLLKIRDVCFRWPEQNFTSMIVATYLKLSAIEGCFV